MILELVNEVDRPLIRADELFDDCTALFDTGALIPVWTKEEEILKRLGAEFIKKDYEFSGFGGKTTGNLYRLNFTLGEYTYPNMPIVAAFDEAIPGYLLLSATMFSEMDVTIRNSNKTIEIVPFTNQKCFNISVNNQVLSQ